MAYFPNGASSEILENQCCECIHADDDVLCPIAYVQMLYNYTQCNNDKLRECLRRLIGNDGICRMKPLIDKRRTDRRQHKEDDEK